MVIDRPNQVWAADITYIPLGRGFLYLVAILDDVDVTARPRLDDDVDIRALPRIRIEETSRASMLPPVITTPTRR